MRRASLIFVAVMLVLGLLCVGTAPWSRVHAASDSSLADIDAKAQARTAAHARVNLAENAGLAATGYRLQFYQLLAQPFYLAAMVLLAAAVSLRLFRFGGVQKMVLSGISAGFLLFVLSKITEDMSKSELLSPVMAAWIPVLVGSLTGFVALLYQEDG